MTGAIVISVLLLLAVLLAIAALRNAKATIDELALQQAQGRVLGPCAYWGWKSLWRIVPRHCYHIEMNSDRYSAVIYNKLLDGSKCRVEHRHVRLVCCQCGHELYRPVHQTGD